MGQTYLIWSLFYTKVLTFSPDLLNTVLNVKPECLNGSRMVGHSSAAYPRSHMVGRASQWCHSPASEERIVLPIAGPGKEPDSKSQVPFPQNAYCFCTILKSKNDYLNHNKSGAVCSAVESLNFKEHRTLKMCFVSSVGRGHACLVHCCILNVCTLLLWCQRSMHVHWMNAGKSSKFLKALAHDYPRYYLFHKESWKGEEG